ASKTFLAIDHAAPIYFHPAHVNPEFSGMADLIQHLGAAHQDFFRITSIERAQSADIAAVDKGDAMSGSGDAGSGAQAGVAASDGDEIVFHASPPVRRLPAAFKNTWIEEAMFTSPLGCARRLRRNHGKLGAAIMKAVAVFPGKANSAHLAALDKPSLDSIPNRRGVLVRVLRVGVDGTDKEINAAESGAAANGYAFQVTGHESFGVVEKVGPNVSERKPG